jgi:hypothetical protein
MLNLWPSSNVLFYEKAESGTWARDPKCRDRDEIRDLESRDRDETETI